MENLDVCIVPKVCLHKKENGGCMLHVICDPTIDKCKGCDRVPEGYCVSYPKPALMWRITEVCPMASHVKYQSPKIIAEKQRVGQQKQKKKK
jgi:hypothetical protein